MALAPALLGLLLVALTSTNAQLVNNHCTGCAFYSKFDSSSVWPGPCRSLTRSSLCFNLVAPNNTCPRGSYLCTSANETSFIPARAPRFSFFAERPNATVGEVTLLRGTTNMWLPDPSSAAYLSRSFCIHAEGSDSCLAFSGKLLPNQTYWHTFNSLGAFVAVESAASVVYTRTVFIVRDPVSYLVRFYFNNIVFASMTPAQRARFQQTLWQSIAQAHADISNTSVLNISLSPSEAILTADVSVSSQTVSNTLQSIASSLVIKFDGTNYSVSLSNHDEPASDTSSSSSIFSSTAGIMKVVLPIIVGVILVGTLIAVASKRRRSDRGAPELAPHKRTLTLRTEEVHNLYRAIELGNAAGVKELLDGHVQTSAGFSSPEFSSPGHVPTSPTTDGVASPVPHSVLVFDFEEESLPFTRGCPPLVVAVMHNQKDIVRTLLQSSCDVNATNSAGQTPLHLACMLNADPAIVSLLVRAGCSLDMTDCEHATALWYACLHGNLAHVVLLLKALAPADIPDARGMTPLIVAASRGHTEVLEELLKTPSLHVNEKDMNGWTALHWACATDQPVLVARLLAHRRVRAAVHNTKDESPLHLAAREGAYECATLLLEHEHKPELMRLMIVGTTDAGMTTEQLAADRGHTELAALLEHKRLSLEEGSQPSASDAGADVPSATSAAVFKQESSVSPPPHTSSAHTEEEDEDEDSRRVRMRKYMRARRKATKMEEIACQQRVDELAKEHDMLVQELARAREEAAFLRDQMFGGFDASVHPFSASAL